MGNKHSRKAHKNGKSAVTTETVHVPDSDPQSVHLKSPQFPSVVESVITTRRQKRKERSKTPEEPTLAGGNTPPLPRASGGDHLVNIIPVEPDGLYHSPDDFVELRSSVISAGGDPEDVMMSRFTMFEVPTGVKDLSDASLSPMYDNQYLKGLNSMVSRTSRTLQAIRQNETSSSGIDEKDARVLEVKSTLSRQDLRETLTAVSYAVYYHIVAGESSLVKTFVPELSEVKNPTLSPVKGPSPLQMPNAKDIADYLEHMFKYAQLSPETAVVVVVYVERLLAISSVTLDRTNWRRTMLICTLLAAKAWEDEAVWNVDFVQLFPGLDVKDLNRVEMKMLELLQYSITVKASQYARYYFELRHLMETREYRFTLPHLNDVGLKRLEEKSAAAQIQMERGVLSSMSVDDFSDAADYVI